MSTPATYRGTTNTNARGNVRDRLRRREYLVATYRADAALVAARYDDGTVYVGATPFTPDPDAAAYVHLLVRMDDQRRRPGGRIVGQPEPLLTEPPRVLAACRCYRCGMLLHAGVAEWELEGTVTSDRIIPGCEGGTYRRGNLRPACATCNERTGGQLGAARKAVGSRR